MPKQAKSDVAAPQATPVEKDWIAAAREMLIEGGVGAVQINKLAARLGVTRGGFYWRFQSRRELLDHLLADWENSNTRTLVLAVSRAGTPQERYRRLVRLWLDEKDFDPALDTAVRQWGSIDADVRARVHDADLARIDAIAAVFVDAGQDKREAEVRARIIYFHQVGYYTLGLDESQQQRRALVDMYTRILTGFS